MWLLLIQCPGLPPSKRTNFVLAFKPDRIFAVASETAVYEV